ncbi:MAG: hypothetical protein NT086_20685 [Proteobacteria bacterium]|nr:hypothetical protein [Pseudomonadota bacterium]
MMLSNQSAQFPLFGDLLLCVKKWPRGGTMAHAVLMRLLSGERLTQVSYGFHSWRLGAHIHVLAELFFPIERLEVPNPHGGKLVITEYYLSAENIRLLRQCGAV